jgi:hypothetical protein
VQARQALAAFGAALALAAPGLAVHRTRHAPVGVAHIGQPHTRTRHPAHSPPALSIGLADCVFVDTSRETYDVDTGRELPGRRLVTEIRYPTRAGRAGAVTIGAAPARRAGPFPLVVFAPGYALDPGTYGPLLNAWVRAGFVVAGVTFPDTNAQAVAHARYGDPEAHDDVNQPGDVAFVARRLEAAARGTSPNCAFLRGAIDANALFLAGQSDGGNTVAALAYDRTEAALLTGLHVRAVAVLSGATLLGTHLSTYRAVAGDPPLLAVESRSDACNPPQAAARLYDAIVQADRYFLLTEAATHLGPYDGREPRELAVVARVTASFFDATLSGGALAPRLRAALGASPLATLSAGTAVHLPPVHPRAAACFAGLASR